MIEHAPFPKGELDRQINREKATLSEQNLDGIAENRAAIFQEKTDRASLKTRSNLS